MQLSLTYYQLKAERLKLTEGVKQQEEHKLYLLMLQMGLNFLSSGFSLQRNYKNGGKIEVGNQGEA